MEIVNEDKIKLLYDPIIEVKNINYKKNQKKNTTHTNYFLAAGRLTKQKNFLFLCKAFNKLINKYPDIKLLIAGSGEDKEKIIEYIIKNKLKKNIFLINHVDNIFPLMKDAEGFILSSLWEDPGFVIIEAAFCRTPIFSSNCITGPKEIIKNNVNGFLYDSNNLSSFLENFEIFMEKKNNSEILLNSIKYTKKFTLFNHYISFKKIMLTI